MNNKKTKTIRTRVEDAFVIEQAARELAADLQTEITVSDVMMELVKDVRNAKKRVKDKIDKISKK